MTKKGGRDYSIDAISLTNKQNNDKTYRMTNKAKTKGNIGEQEPRRVKYLWIQKSENVDFICQLTLIIISSLTSIIRMKAKYPPTIVTINPNFIFLGIGTP